MIPPWVLRLSLALTLVAGVLLVGVIVGARLVRHRRAGRQARELGSLRGDVLTLAAGDDRDGQAERRLRLVPLRLLGVLDPYLVGMLSKVRGAPAVRIADLLTLHGARRTARDGLTSRSRTRRAHGAWTLALLRDEHAAEEILPLLQDRDRGVAVTAARSLGLLGDPLAAPALLASLAPGRRGRGSLPVWVVVEALAALGPAAGPPVGRALDSDDPTTRAAAAEAVGLGQLVAQAPRLRRLVAVESDPTVLAGAATALGHVGGSADLAPLRPLLHADTPRAVRLAAARAVGEIGGAGAISDLAGLLDDADPAVAELAAERLALAGTAGERALTEAARGRDDEAGAARFGLVLRGLRGGPGRAA